MTGIDFTPILSIILSLAGVVITAAVPIITVALLKRFNVANDADVTRKDADLTHKVAVAADAAVGEAQRYALAHAGGLKDVKIHNDAVAAGVAYVVQQLPDTLKVLNITDASVKAMVTARLGRVLEGTK